MTAGDNFRFLRITDLDWAVTHIINDRRRSADWFGLELYAFKMYCELFISGRAFSGVNGARARGYDVTDDARIRKGVD